MRVLRIVLPAFFYAACSAFFVACSTAAEQSEMEIFELRSIGNDTLPAPVPETQEGSLEVVNGTLRLQPDHLFSSERTYRASTTGQLSTSSREGTYRQSATALHLSYNDGSTETYVFIDGGTRLRLNAASSPLPGLDQLVLYTYDKRP